MSDYSEIPDSLKQADRWVGFMSRHDSGKGKEDRIPIDPKTLRGAKMSDPATWGSFQEAADAVGSPCSTAWRLTAPDGTEKWEQLKGTVEGIGLVLAKDLFGLVLEQVFIEAGHLSPVARDVVSTLDSYTEYSRGGQSLRIVCKGSIPEVKKEKDGIRVLGSREFIVMTGKVYGQKKPVRECTKEAALINARYLQDRPGALEDTRGPGPGTLQGPGGLRGDDRLIQKAMNGRHGDRFRALWSGDYSAPRYRDPVTRQPDRSLADQALANDLIFWCRGDVERAGRLFEHSGLMRPAWLEAYGPEGTYGQMIMRRALEFYQGLNPQQGTASLIGGTDGTGAFDPGEDDGEPLANDPRPDGIDAYIDDGGLHFDIMRFSAYKHISTGFDRLDKASGGLYPAFYVLGAVAGMGKSTLCLQLGDHLATAGHHVLYFSFEQNKLELLAKSLSRFTAQTSRETAVQSLQIRRGETTGAVAEAVMKYRGAVAQRMSIISCGVDTHTAYITGYIRRYMEANPDIKPICFIDYLQMIPADEPCAGAGNGAETTLHSLKKLQSENELILFVASSVKWENALNPIDFSSFEESGAIEFTADCVWGLQPQFLRRDSASAADGERGAARGRETARAAKDAVPRMMEIVSLKNRYSKDFECGFRYFPQFDLFEQDEDFEKQG